jgi:hypothetical protein
MILAIDPGDIMSAYCFIDEETYEPVEFAIVDNYDLIDILYQKHDDYDKLIVEMIASYGMPVGKEIFETCVWVGRFIQYGEQEYHYIYRRDVKLNLCNSMKAKDSNVRQALIDRFGVVGTKKNQGWFYGFKSDIWQAYAVGVTYLDMLEKEIVEWLN